MITQYLCYQLRLFLVLLALPGFPGLAVWLLPEGVHVVLFVITIAGSLVLVGCLSRYLLVLAPYHCDSCGHRTMRIQGEDSERETVMSYRCDSCGYETDTGVAWHQD